MARKRPPRPSWLDEATKQADDHTNDYKKNLRAIATTLARQQHAEVVLVNHVDESMEALARCGLRRRPFWQRPEFQITLGSILVGGAMASPDILPVFFSDELLQKQGITMGTVIFSSLLGALITFHGWYRAYLGK